MGVVQTARPNPAVRPPTGRDRTRPYWLLLAVPIVVHVLGLLRFGSWLVDDGLICAAYSRSLAEAGTFAQTPAAVPVEGVSDPLWTVLLALLRLVGLFDAGHVWWGHSDYVWVVRGLATLCFVGIISCFYRSARELVGPGTAAVASAVGGTCLALVPPWAIWSISGLENPLFGLLAASLLLVTVRASVRGRLLLPSTGVVCAVLVLLSAATRPDGIILGGAYPLLVLVRHLRQGRELVRAWLVYGVVVLVPLTVLLLWRYAVFGLWVPNTAVVKQHAIPTLSTLAHQPRRLAADLTSPLCCLMLGLLVAWLLIQRLRTPAVWALLTALTLIGLGAAGFILLDPDWMPYGRFTTATVVFSTGFVTLASGVLLSWLQSAGGLRLAAGSVAMLVALGAIAVISTQRVDRFVSDATISGCYAAARYGELFNWYADQLTVGGDGSLLTPDIGGTLMTSRLRVVDLAGLTDPTIGRARGAEDPAAIRNYVLTEVRPTFMHLHAPWSAGLEQDPRFVVLYRPLGPAGDYVRRDVVLPNADLVRIDRRSHELVDAVGLSPGTLPDCGALPVGKLPE